ncbi:MAG: MFS transporter [Planctomycetes bacterium]|nr:MFS transporter [Planctomycetota bacterium]
MAGTGGTREAEPEGRSPSDPAGAPEDPGRAGAAFEGSVRRNLRWNFLFNVLDVGFFDFGVAFAAPITVLAVFVKELSGRDFDVGVVGALWPLGWFLPQLPTAFIVERLRRKKPYVLAVGLVERLPFLLMGLSVLLVGTRSPALLLALFYAAYAMQTLGGGFVATGWHELIARVIPIARRGTFFGTAYSLGGLLRVVGGILSGLLIERLAFPTGYGVSFLITFLIVMISWGFLCQNREPPPPPAHPCPDVRTYIRKVSAILRAHEGYRRFLVSQIWIILGSMGATFVAVHGMRAFHLSLQHVGYMTAALSLSESAATPLVGHVGDALGHKWGLVISGLACVAAMGCALAAWCPSMIYLSILLLGVYYAGRKVSGTVIAFEFGDLHDRPTYVGGAGTLLAPFHGLGPLAGGLLAQSAGYATLFGVSGVVSLAALVWFILHVPDPRRGTPAVRWEELDGRPWTP